MYDPHDEWDEYDEQDVMAEHENCSSIRQPMHDPHDERDDQDEFDEMAQEHDQEQQAEDEPMEDDANPHARVSSCPIG